MEEGSKRLFAHTCNGSHPPSVPCREQLLARSGLSQHQAGTVTETSLWAGQGLWCPRATSVTAKSGFIPVLSTAKSFPPVMNFRASFIQFPVPASLYQILFIIPPLLFNPADNNFLLEHDWFWVNILKTRFLYSICTHRHVHTHIPPTHTLTFSPEQIIWKSGLCRLPCTDHHRNRVWLLTLFWGYQHGHLWHMAISSQVAKIVN